MLPVNCPPELAPILATFAPAYTAAHCAMTPSGQTRQSVGTRARPAWPTITLPTRQTTAHAIFVLP